MSAKYGFSRQILLALGLGVMIALVIGCPSDGSNRRPVEVTPDRTPPRTPTPPSSPTPTGQETPTPNQGICPLAGSGRIGDTCTSETDCTQTPGSPFCQAGFWPDGYCLDGTGGAASNCDTGDPLGSCSDGCSVCTTIPYFNAARCVRRCETNSDCRTGYTCQPADDATYSWCSPF